MLLDLINIRKVRKAILYLLVIALTVWMQFSLLPDLRILGVKPYFAPVVAVAIGLWEGGVWGGVLGLLAGLCCDLAMNESTVTFLILFAAYGFFSGVLGSYLINRRFFSFLLLSAATLLLTALAQIAPFWLFRGVPLDALLPIALLQTLWSVPFAVPAYYLCKKISGRRRIN